MSADRRARYEAAAAGKDPTVVMNALRSAQYSALVHQVALLSMHVSLGGAEVVALLSEQERARHVERIEQRIDDRALEIAIAELEQS
jgi:hypothetical protein